MLLATWNVNGVRARLEFVLRWLRARRPDVVGLQELKVTDERFPRDEVEAAGYRVVTHGQKAWNGVAILSRATAEVTQVGLPGQEDFGARMLSADIGGLSFTTVYCPNGKAVGHEDFPRKLAWLDALAEHFASSHDPGRPVALCGDFNICPTPLDSWNEDKLRGTTRSGPASAGCSTGDSATLFERSTRMFGRSPGGTTAAAHSIAARACASTSCWPRRP
jgi:exodeoxyribonuclease-3